MAKEAKEFKNRSQEPESRSQEAYWRGYAIVVLLAPGFWLLTPSLELVVFSLIVAALAVWRHRPNIDRLLQGKENRFGTKR